MFDLDNCSLEIFNVEVEMEARLEWVVSYMVSNLWFMKQRKRKQKYNQNKNSNKNGTPQRNRYTMTISKNQLTYWLK